MEEAELPAHLEALRRYFLMGRVRTPAQPGHTLSEIACRPLAPRYDQSRMRGLRPECGSVYSLRRVFFTGRRAGRLLLGVLRRGPLAVPDAPSRDGRGAGAPRAVHAGGLESPREAFSWPVVEVSTRPHACPDATPTSFAQAAAKSTAGESPLFGHVRIRFRSDQAPAPAPPPPPPLRASPAEVSAAAAAWVAANVEMHSKLPSLGDGWDGVTLDYTVEWPLGLLLSPEVIARYATVFQYCFRFRRAQRALEGAWVALRRRRGRERLLALRHRMEHLLACWMHYVQARSRPRTDGYGAPAQTRRPSRAGRPRLPRSSRSSSLRTNPAPAPHTIPHSSPPRRSRAAQADVIETQAALLQQRLSAVTDFEAAARAHSAFLAALTQQLFLELRVVGKTWEGILQSCVALATAARARRNPTPPIPSLSTSNRPPTFITRAHPAPL